MASLYLHSLLKLFRTATGRIKFHSQVQAHNLAHNAKGTFFCTLATFLQYCF